MKKRISIIILLCIVLNIICFIPVYAYTGYVDSAINKIKEIQNEYPIGSKFNISFNGATECKGFADYVYNRMFGLILPPYTSNKNTLTHNSNINVVEEITSQPSITQLQNMFSKGRTGDIIQGRKQSTQHTMIFMYATDKSIHVYDCNSDGNNTVKERDLLYSDIAGNGYYTGYVYGISLYTAPNYAEKFSTGPSLGDPVNIGDNFYAYIINTKAWLHLTEDDDKNVRIHSETGNLNQKWHFERQSDGSYKITNTWDGKCLDVNNASSESGANVQVYDDNESQAQRWFIYGEAANYKLKAACGNCVLDIQDGYLNDGDNVQMWEWSDNDAQKFQIWKLDDNIPEHIEGINIGIIYNVASGKILTVNEDDYICLEGENGFANQVWRFWRCEDGSYRIRSAYNGKMLDGDASSLKMHTWEDTDADNQHFFFYKQGNGFIIRPRFSSNGVLDCEGGYTTDGTQIQIFDRNNTDAQIFGVYYADDVQLKAPSLSVSVDKTTQKAIFNWSEVYGESRYDIKIWKGSASVGDAYYIEQQASRNSSIQLPPGNYEGYVDAVNYFDCKTSNVVSFSISEVSAPTPTPTIKPSSPTPTPTPTVTPMPTPTIKPSLPTPTPTPTVKPSSPTPTPTVTPTPTPSPSPGLTACFTISSGSGYSDVQNTSSKPQTVAVIIAEYDGGAVLKKVNSAYITFEAGETRTFMHNNETKIFVWNSLSGMLPLIKE